MAGRGDNSKAKAGGGVDMEPMRRAITGCVRSIAGDPQVEVAFANERPGLAGERIPLTVCPLSNVRLRAVPSLAEHPLPQLLDAGVVVTINSDDPAYFGGYADDNYAAVAETLDLDDDALAQLARSSVEASFLPPDRKAGLHQEIDGWLADSRR